MNCHTISIFLAAVAWSWPASIQPNPANAAEPAATQPAVGDAELERLGVRLYNDGVQLYQAGKAADALAKLRQSLDIFRRLHPGRDHFTVALAANGLASLPNFAPKAKRAIYLHLVGAPPQMDLFDYKPQMQAMYDKDLPDSIRQGQRLTTMTSGQSRFLIAPSIFKFKQHGNGGAWMSELLPFTAKMTDDICIIRSMNTEAINHEPAITFIQSGHQLPGRPCIGSWLSYGLGSMNQNLPTFVVLHASHSNPRANVQAIAARLWSSGFLSAQYAGVELRSAGDPVLFINNPHGINHETFTYRHAGLDFRLSGVEPSKIVPGILA